MVVKHAYSFHCARMQYHARRLPASADDLAVAAGALCVRGRFLQFIAVPECKSNAVNIIITQ